MEEIRHVTVQDMLKARDERVMRQQRLLQHHQPLISFTMNIAGSVKVDADIRRAFCEGERWINAQIRSGALKNGTQLPTVREKAEQLRLSCGTVKHVYD